MTKINNKRIRLILKEIIQSIHKNASYGWISDKVKYPYVTYEYEMRYSGNKGIGTLEINVWDLSESTEQVEDIADNLENGLNELIYNDEHTILKFYTNSRLAVLDDNKDIKRRRLLFEMQYYPGRNE